MSVLDLNEAAVTTSVGPAPVTQAPLMGVGTGPEQAHADPPRLLSAAQRMDRLSRVLWALSGNMGTEQAVVVGEPRTQDGIRERFARGGLSFGR